MHTSSTVGYCGCSLPSLSAASFGAEFANYCTSLRLFLMPLRSKASLGPDWVCEKQRGQSFDWLLHVEPRLRLTFITRWNAGALSHGTPRTQPRGHNEQVNSNTCISCGGRKERPSLQLRLHVPAKQMITYSRSQRLSNGSDRGTSWCTLLI